MCCNNATEGTGEVPFLQRAFTISFKNGKMYANNNIVGIGKTGNVFGIPVGYYDGYSGAVDIDHDADVTWVLDVFLVNNNTMELYDIGSKTLYFLKGYQVNTLCFMIT